MSKELSRIHLRLPCKLRRTGSTRRVEQSDSPQRLEGVAEVAEVEKGTGVTKVAEVAEVAEVQNLLRKTHRTLSSLLLIPPLNPRTSKGETAGRPRRGRTT